LPHYARKDSKRIFLSGTSINKNKEEYYIYRYFIKYFGYCKQKAEPEGSASVGLY